MDAEDMAMDVITSMHVATLRQVGRQADRRYEKGARGLQDEEEQDEAH
jgi:hypothetical protein